MRNEYKLILVLFCCTLFSCVTKDKYNELVQVKDYLEQENKNFQGLEEENRNLRAQQRKSHSDLVKAQREITELQATINTLDRNYKDLSNRYNRIISDNRQVGDLSAGEKQSLQEELARKQLEIEQKGRQLQSLQYNLSQSERKIQELSRLLRENDGN